MKTQLTQQEYRKTELGQLPKDWDVVKITGVVEFERGSEPGSDNYNDRGQGIRFLRVSDISGNRKEFIYTISKNIKLCSPEDVLITFDGSPGIVKKGFNGAYSSGIRKVKIINKDTHLDYIYYILLTDSVQGIIEKYSAGVTIKHASKSIPHIIIPLPQIQEQQKIAFVLSTIQEAGEKTENVINSLKELKKSLMKHLFTYGAVSFEDTEKVKLKEIDGENIPENWEILKFGELGDYTTGKLNSEAGIKFGKYPFFTCSQETFRIDSYSFDQEALLLAGNNARGIYSVKYYSGKFDAYQRTYVLTIKDKTKVDYHYLLYELTRKLETLRGQSLGSTTKYITAGIITNLEIVLPSLPEQQQIASILSTVDEKIESEENKKNALDELFKSMLHNLMTAKIRVEELEMQT